MGLQAGAQQQQAGGGLGRGPDGLPLLAALVRFELSRACPPRDGPFWFSPPGWERTVMVRAFASPQPLLSRRFLERALVISALVHFTAAGLFRAADERSRAGEAEEPAVPTWKGFVDVHPVPLPIPWRIAPPRSTTDGVIVPAREIRPPDI